MLYNLTKPQVACCVLKTKIFSSTLENALAYYVQRCSCFDHNFLQFSKFLAKKLALFSKTNVMINFLRTLALFRVKNTYFVAIFWRKYCKDNNIGPWKLSSSQATWRRTIRTRWRPRTRRSRRHLCSNA
jgi:hypothetical protein